MRHKEKSTQEQFQIFIWRTKQMVVSFIDVRNAIGEMSVQGGGECNSQFNFGHFESEMHVRHSDGITQWKELSGYKKMGLS